MSIYDNVLKMNGNKRLSEATKLRFHLDNIYQSNGAGSRDEINRIRYSIRLLEMTTEQLKKLSDGDKKLKQNRIEKNIQMHKDQIAYGEELLEKIKDGNSPESRNAEHNTKVAMQWIKMGEKGLKKYA